jgi:hypothetical protein
MVHQLYQPAAILKDMYLWMVNHAWADICGLPAEQLIGAGIEEFIHTASLKTFIGYLRQHALGAPRASNRCRVSFNDPNGGSTCIGLNILRLTNPSDALLLIGERRE